MGINPFRYSGPVAADDLIDRDAEAAQLLATAWEGNNSRVVAPRRFGKTSLLRPTVHARVPGGAVGAEVTMDPAATCLLDRVALPRRVVLLDEFFRVCSTAGESGSSARRWG